MLKRRQLVAQASEPCRPGTEAYPHMKVQEGKRSGVLQPAELQFAELNLRSALLGSWDVGIFNPGIDK